MAQREAVLDRALAELEDRQLIYEERAIPEEEYSFQHVLAQETVYHNILRRRRVVFHRQVAEAIEGLYARVWTSTTSNWRTTTTRPAMAEKAVEYLLKAAEKARRALQNEAAIAFFEHALQQLEDSALGQAQGDWVLAAHVGLGQVHHDSQDHMVAAEAHLRQAIALGHALALAPRDRVRIYYWLGEVLFWQGRHQDRIPPG